MLSILKEPEVDRMFAKKIISLSYNRYGYVAADKNDCVAVKTGS